MAGYSKSIDAQVRQALRRAKRVQETVRKITLEALKQGNLDRPSLEKVTREVLDAIHEAARAQGSEAQQTIKQAISGLDQALAVAAQALKLSIEEAADRADQFSREDLARARSDLRQMRRIFLQTLRDTARAGRGTAAGILNDLARHARASGTAVGRQIEVMRSIPAHAAKMGRASFTAGVSAATTSGVMLARVAAGVLAGIADSAEKRTARRRSR